VFEGKSAGDRCGAELSDIGSAGLFEVDPEDREPGAGKEAQGNGRDVSPNIAAQQHCGGDRHQSDQCRTGHAIPVLRPGGCLKGRTQLGVARLDSFLASTPPGTISGDG